MKSTTQLGQFVLLFALVLCSCFNTVIKRSPIPNEETPPIIGIKSIPVAIGDTPATSANAIVGTWQAKNLTVSSGGNITGQIEINLSRPITFPQYQDVLMIQVSAYYILPLYGDWRIIPAGEFIPVKASQSTDTSIIFDINGNFEFPALKIDTDGGMPLDYLQVTMVWYRLFQVSENGYIGYYPAKIGTPNNYGDLPWHSKPILDQPLSLNGTIDTNVGGNLDYRTWFVENIHLPENPKTTPSSK